MKSGWLPPPPALPPRPSTSQVCSAHARLPLDQSNKGRAVPLNSTSVSSMRDGWRGAATDGRVSSPPPQVSPFVSLSEKTPLKTVQQPNFADFSHFREEVSVKRDVPPASVLVWVSACSEGRKTEDGRKPSSLEPFGVFLCKNAQRSLNLFVCPLIVVASIVQITKTPACNSYIRAMLKRKKLNSK